MKSFITLLLAAYASAVQIKPEGFEAEQDRDVKEDQDFLLRIQEGLGQEDLLVENAGECNGAGLGLGGYAVQGDYAVCGAPICCVDQLDCNCHLPNYCEALGAGQTQDYLSGSRAVTEAYQTQIPDKFYNIDAISCKDQSTAANEVYNGIEVGTHSFTIAGQIDVTEDYKTHAGNARQKREKENACYHQEKRIELADNVPGAPALPCVCSTC